MIKLIQNIDIYAPEHLGKKDVLIIHDKIVKIADAGSLSIPVSYTHLTLPTRSAV